MVRRKSESITENRERSKRKEEEELEQEPMYD